jgi:zinc protease
VIPIVRTEVDGLPVFWADVPRQFAGALVFRVGRSDETLTTGGLSHLVEHLALPTERRRSVDFNGTVDGLETTFFARGARDSVLDFLSEAADTLGRLPLERLEVERRILLTEAAGVGSDPVRMMSWLRFGPVGHGLVGYHEHGLAHVGPAETSAWVADRFTRENAAVWLTGEPPPGFALTLPAGRRVPAVEPDPIPYLTFPCAYDRGPDGVVAVSIVARRTTPLMAAIEVAQHRLMRTLRYEEGLSYAVEWWFGPLTATHAQSVLWADLLAENAERVRELLLATLYDLAEHGPTEEELEHDLHELRRFFDDPDSLASSVAADASRELIGMPLMSPDAYL